MEWKKKFIKNGKLIYEAEYININKNKKNILTNE